MPLISTPQLLVSSSRLFIERGAGETPLLKHLAKDQMVSATVLQTLPDRQAVLSVNGQEVTAKTFLPLTPGETILLKVEQTGTHQVLKFMGRAEDVPGADQRFLPGSLGKAKPYLLLTRLLEGPLPPDASARLSERLTALKTLLSSVSFKSGEPSDGFLKRLLDAGGLLWESKLAAATGKPVPPDMLQRLAAGDLKALALQLQSDSGLMPGMADQVKGFLDGMEQLQLLNQHLLDTAGRLLLSVPVLWPDAVTFGQLFLDLGESGEGAKGRENKVVTISLLLSLSQLGDLRADFSILKKEITGTFGVSDEAALELISPYLPELDEKLSAHGFLVHDISCKILPPEELSETSLVSRAAAPSEGLLNLVV